ncbi:amphi-Trp domain-containing protein [Halosegnis rubeus]|uniref:Amphi-Trp domain-containing protein n=1 Tax=Halosegnis rubeus TaxID=2212850 RepID=A0A5N5U670_9EURY|nr:amphi-Trp domain-containing protein [Halosegnis rubeus]
MPEEILSKSERVQTREEIGLYLCNVADKLEQGDAIILKSGSESVTMEPPARPTFEIKILTIHMDYFLYSIHSTGLASISSDLSCFINNCGSSGIVTFASSRIFDSSHGSRRSPITSATISAKRANVTSPLELFIL